MSEDPYKIVEPSPLKQLGLSLLLGIGAAAIAYKISDSMAKPDTLLTTGHASRGAFQFVWYITAFAGGAVFLLTMKIYKTYADKKYRESLGPPKARSIERVREHLPGT